MAGNYWDILVIHPIAVAQPVDPPLRPEPWPLRRCCSGYPAREGAERVNHSGRMKFCLFYRDAFTTGGQPSELRGLAAGLSLHHSVTIWGKETARSEPIPASVARRTYRGLADLARNMGQWLDEDEVDAMILFGFYLPETAIAARTAKRRGVTTVLHPGAHVMEPVLSNKIFYETIEVAQLETIESPGIALRRARAAASPLIKRLWLRSVGGDIVAHSDCVAVLSQAEELEFRRNFPRFTGSFPTLRWGCDEVTGIDDKAHYFFDRLRLNNDGRANFVYWGRLDWHYKGIDRMLAGVAAARRQSGSAELPFRLFLCGPDYNGGLARAQHFIDAHGLSSSVSIITQFEGDRTPLRDADGSVLLSRWDGLPRSFRESIWLGVPVLASAETHAHELLRRYGAGIPIADADDADAVGAGLIALSDAATRARSRGDAKALRARLTWAAVARDFVDELAAVTGGALAFVQATPV